MNYPLFLLVLAFLINPALATSATFPGASWKSASPEQMSKWSTKTLEQAKKNWLGLNGTGLMVIEDGSVVASWGDVKKPVNCHSVRKSFLSALYGIYIEKKQINLASTLGEEKIDDTPTKLSQLEKTASIEDLLKARSGIYINAAYETKSMRQKRPKRASHPPGKFWYYNNWDFNALGTIFTNRTKRSVFDAFKSQIADPIGMEDFDLSHTKFVFEKDKSSHPAYVFHMSTRDRARFGLLFLNEGTWNKKKIISKNWITRSTKSYSNAGKGVGYGYLWWISENGKHLGASFKGTPFSARGNHGQYIIVIPEMNLVMAHTVDKQKASVARRDFNKVFQMILKARGHT